jgi:hypothetical protein
MPIASIRNTGRPKRRREHSALSVGTTVVGDYLLGYRRTP